MKITRIASLLALSFALFSSVASFAAGEIGTVESSKIMKDYKLAQEAQRKIMSLRDEFNAKMQTLSDEYEKEAKTLDEKGKEKKQEEIRTKIEAEEARIKAVMNSIQKEVEDNIRSAITAVAKEEGVSAVVSSSVVYYGGKDLTDKVLSKLTK